MRYSIDPEDTDGGMMVAGIEQEAPMTHDPQDPFTTAARAEAEDRWWNGAVPPDLTPPQAWIHGFREGAPWARDHLAGQEETEEEVLAAVDAWRRHLRLAHPIEGLEPSCDECGYAFGYPGITDAEHQARLLGHAMREALAAARRVRQEAR